jgi:pSer/pThr/pTyr-binding forkhead associated (FHA) protein
MSQKTFKLKRAVSHELIPIGDVMLVGRSEDADLKLIEGKISGKHALLTVHDGCLWIYDLRSTNGILVNGKRVTAKTRLSSHDQLRFDTEEFLVLVDGFDDNRMIPPAWLSLLETGRTRYLSPQALREEQERSRLVGVAGQIGQALTFGALLFENSDNKRTYIQLRADAAGEHKWTIGSDPKCDVQIRLDSVSRLHAEIVNDYSRWWIRDAASQNGTFVNSRRIMSKCFLAENDAIRFGTVQCIFDPMVELDASELSKTAELKLWLRKMWLVLKSLPLRIE